jgi:hypothetical protein
MSSANGSNENGKKFEPLVIVGRNAAVGVSVSLLLAVGGAVWALATERAQVHSGIERGVEMHDTHTERIKRLEANFENLSLVISENQESLIRVEGKLESIETQIRNNQSERFFRQNQ